MFERAIEILRAKIIELELLSAVSGHEPGFNEITKELHEAIRLLQKEKSDE